MRSHKVLFFVGLIFLACKPAFSFVGLTAIRKSGGTSASSPFVILSSASKSSTDTNGVTTGTGNTTGATGIFMAKTWYSQATEPALSDTVGSTITCRTEFKVNLFNSMKICYIANPTTSATYAVTTLGTGNYSGVAWAAVSGNAASPYDTENGANSALATTLATGAVSPTQDFELLFAAFSAGSAGTLTIDSGFSVITQSQWNANGYGIGIAIKLNGSGTAGVSVNPIWANSGLAATCVSSIATFKAAL